MFSLRVLVSADKNTCTIIATVDSCVRVYVMSARKHFVVVGKNFVYFFSRFITRIYGPWSIHLLAGRRTPATAN